jgi:hypothetical protein
MGPFLPVGYIALDKVQPYLSVSADDLRRIYFDLMLQICGQYLRLGCHRFTHKLFRALYPEQRRSNEIVRTLPNIEKSLDILCASLPSEV